MTPAWEAALRAAEDGDLRLLGALLFRAAPAGDGSTSLPTEVVYALARLFTPRYPQQAKLVIETATDREQATAQRHERIALEILELMEGGEKLEDAAKTAAEKFGVSKRTAKTAWGLMPSAWRPPRRNKSNEI